MPRIPRGQLAVGAEGLLVQDSRLFPEGALRRHRQNICGRLHKYLRVLLRGIGAHNGVLCRRPCRQRAELHAHHRQDGRFPEDAGVGKAHRLRVSLVNIESEVIGQEVTKIRLQFRQEALAQKCLGSGVGFLIELVLFRTAAVAPGLVLFIAQQPPVQNDVDVLRKAFNKSEAFRQAGAALEGHMLCPRAVMEQIVQRPADPEILFHDSGAHTVSFGGIAEKRFSLRLRKPD